MKLKIDRKMFAQALAEVAPFAPSKPVIAIQKNAKITTKDNWMKLECGSNEASVIKYVEMLECDSNGSFLVNISDFNKFIQKTKGDDIEIEIEDMNVKVKHSKGTSEFQGNDPKEFPTFRMPEKDAVETKVNAGVLADFVSKGRGFVMNNNTKPQMGAVYVYIREGRFGFCATDTTKMIHGSVNADGNVEDVNWLVMPAIFSSLVNICKANASLEAQVKITDTHVSYRVGNIIIQSILAKQAYPDFRRLLKMPWTMECSVDKSDLVDSLNRTAMFCGEANCVKVNVSRFDMTLTADNFMEGKKSSETVVHNGCDGELVIGEDVNNMLLGASIFDNGDILIRMSEPDRPMIFAQKEKLDLIVLFMPKVLVNG